LPITVWHICDGQAFYIKDYLESMPNCVENMQFKTKKTDLDTIVSFFAVFSQMLHNGLQLQEVGDFEALI
jgi:hypothetical protein